MSHCKTVIITQLTAASTKGNRFPALATPLSK